MKRHEENSNAHCYVKEANLESLHTVWIQVYDIL